MKKYLMVLSDGETFTDLEGCRIVAVPEDFDESDLDWDDPDVVELVIEFR